jgi:hypothetical protein
MPTLLPHMRRCSELVASFVLSIIEFTGMPCSAHAHGTTLAASDWNDLPVFDLARLQPSLTARPAEEDPLGGGTVLPVQDASNDPQQAPPPRFGPDADHPGPLLESDGRTSPYKEKFAGRSWTKELTRMELVFQGLHAADMVETLECMSRPHCSEKNPILGKRPGTVKVVGFTAVTGVAHYYLMRRIARKSTKLAKIASMVGIAGKAVVVSLNFNELR